MHCFCFKEPTRRRSKKKKQRIIDCINVANDPTETTTTTMNVLDMEPFKEAIIKHFSLEILVRSSCTPILLRLKSPK